MKLFHILNGGIEKVLHFSYHLPAVWMTFGIKVFIQHPGVVAIGPIVHHLSLLVLNHILLVGEGGLCDGIDQIAHAIRFQPESHLQCIFWYNFVIYCSIGIGTTI